MCPDLVQHSDTGSNVPYPYIINIMKIFLLSCVVVWALGTDTRVWAQGREPAVEERIVILANGSSAPSICNWLLDDPDTVGRLQLEVCYDLSHVPDPVSGIVCRNRTVLQIGDSASCYYVQRRHLQDRVATGLQRLMRDRQFLQVPGNSLQYEKTEEERQMEATAGTCDVLNSEIWYDPVSARFTERIHDYSEDNRAWEYVENVPGIDWQLLDRVDTLCSHVCFAASAKFRGREWTVWYAPDIPLSAGPWKLCGLPGLILKAEDSEGHYRWLCVEIRRNNDPLIYYRVPTRRVTRERVIRYLRNVHENPDATLGRDGRVVFWSREDRRPLDESWTVPYNPLERE